MEASKSAIAFYPKPDLGNTRYLADKAPSRVGLLMNGFKAKYPDEMNFNNSIDTKEDNQVEGPQTL